MELIWTETPGERGKEAEQRDSEGQPRGEECRRDKDLYTSLGRPKTVKPGATI